MTNYSDCSTQAFFCEIGKYQILNKREEEIEIDRIYRHKTILSIALASTNSSIRMYFDLVTIRDMLAKKTGRKIKISEWAKAAQITVDELSLIEISAYSEWAKVAQITVDELSLIEKNGVAARANIILSNLRLVVKIAKPYQNRGLDLLDLIQEGTMGLEYSIDRFDRTRGYRFTTYAAHWIKKFICKSIDENARIIRLPRKTIHLLSTIKKIYKNLYIADGEYPSLSKISKSIDLPEQTIRFVLEKAVKVSSLNIKVGDLEDKELLDLLPAQNQEYPIENISVRDSLKTLIMNLDFKERQIINLRYLQDTRNTLSEIGKLLEISGEGVRQIEAKALRKLRNSLNLVNRSI